jgi:hypothetical protein
MHGTGIKITLVGLFIRDLKMYLWSWFTNRIETYSINRNWLFVWSLTLNRGTLVSDKFVLSFWQLNTIQTKLHDSINCEPGNWVHPISPLRPELCSRNCKRVLLILLPLYHNASSADHITKLIASLFCYNSDIVLPDFLSAFGFLLLF